MFKNFLRMLVLLTFLIGIGNVMGSAPGADAWKDDAGHPAPASVRRAADNLWTVVKEEGKAAFDSGYGIRKKTPCGFQRGIAAIITCGINECCISCTEFDKFVHDGNILVSTYERNVIIYNQKEKEVKEALQRFKDAVNISVSRPEVYSGDANICNLGLWIEDNRWSNTLSGARFTFVSASRDLSDVLKSTKAFVKAHGGWVSEGDVKKGTIVFVSG